MTGLVLPRLAHYPDAPHSSGREFAELYAYAAGSRLDPWQEWELEKGLGETADGKWAAFQVTQVVPRQNGKDEIFVALGLGWLFLTGERLIGHSAHEYKTAMEAFRRLVGIIENSDDLRKRVKKIINTNGEEGIELHNGQRMRFLARSKGAGRGFSFDKMIWNEAYALVAAQVDAVLPALSARPNPQIWLGSSPPLDPGTGEALFRARRAALAKTPGVAYFDYGHGNADNSLHLDNIGPCAEGCTHQVGQPGCILDDPAMWRAANPAHPRRISRQAIERERATMDPVGFARERAGIWPPDLSEGFTVISKVQWERLLDAWSGKDEWNPDQLPSPATPIAELVTMQPSNKLTGRPVFALAVSSRSTGPVRASIGMAQRRADGKAHLELIVSGAGTAWVPDAFAKLQAHNPAAVVIDPGSPAGSSIADVEAKGVTVVTMGARDVAQAFGMIYDAATSEKPDDRTVAHIGQSEVMTALQAATTRTVGDGKAWDVRVPGVDITPIDSLTKALWGLAVHGGAPETVAPWVMFA